MTPTEKDAQLGAILRDYKEAREEVMCLVVGIRRAAKTLEDVTEILAKPSDIELASRVGHVDTRDLESVAERIDSVQRVLRHRDALKSQLIELGYRDIIQA
ncbi:MAG: hypothetical protein OXU21_03200 [Chloroflexota bacterium]|nr:hypothetical protein [Chloroflexota bacterium]